MSHVFFYLLVLNNVRFLHSFTSILPKQSNHVTKLFIPKRRINYVDNSDLDRSFRYLGNNRFSTTVGNNQVNDSLSNGDGNNNNNKSKRKLRKDFFSIALPALIQLAAEPLAGLVDTAYLGRLGPEVLGGAGVAISAQYAIAKLYNDPLLRTSISLVAAQDAKSKSEEEIGDDKDSENNEKKNDDLAIAVSTALLLAISVGFIQLFIYYIGSDWIIRVPMGVTESNSMWYSATSYLRVRALGTPASTLWLVANGVFRGLGDTTTPLICSFLFTGLNAILDPIFIFTLGFGASGAAAGTAIAQYIALVPLLILLHKRVNFNIRDRLSELGSSLKMYLEAGSLVLGKCSIYLTISYVDVNMLLNSFLCV